MLYILTSDLFFYNGLLGMYGSKNVIQLSNLEDVKETLTLSDSLLIDTLCCQIKGAEYIHVIQELMLSRIIILSSFRLSRFESLSPVIFTPRNIHPAMLSLRPDIFIENHEIRLPSITLREYIIIIMLMAHCDDIKISSRLNISIATLRAHKFQLMLKLKLKKMSHIMLTEHCVYVNG